MPLGMLLRSPYVACNIADPGRRSHSTATATTPSRRSARRSRWTASSTTAAGSSDQAAAAAHSTAAPSAAWRRTATVSSSSSRTASRCARAASSSPPGSCPSPTAPRSSARSARGSCRTPSSTATCAPSTAGASSSLGGGQSALESAALLHEAGADAEVARPRARHLLPPRRWQLLTRSGRCRGISSRRRRRPGRRQPRSSRGPRSIDGCRARCQDRLARRALRPAGAAWLSPRWRDVPIRSGVEIAGAEASTAGSSSASPTARGRPPTISCSAPATASTSRGTRSSPRDLVARVARVGGHPRLTPGFESSLVPGLHFVGAPAAWSHGPLMRFVAGTDFAAALRSRATSPPHAAAQPMAVARRLVARRPTAPRAAKPGSGGRDRARRPTTARSASCAASAAAASRSASSATATTPSPPARGTRPPPRSTGRGRPTRALVPARARGRGADGLRRCSSRRATRRRRSSPATTPRCSPSGSPLTSPPWETMRFAYDKRLTLSAGRRAGLDVPWTAWSPRDRADLGSRRPRDPLPGRPQAGGQGDLQPPDRRRRRGASTTRAGCCAATPRPAALAAPSSMMVQELIPGWGRRGAVLLRGALPDGRAARRADRAPHAPVPRRLRSREHLRRDRSTIRRSRSPPGALLRHLGFDGLVEVEFKRDPRDGELSCSTSTRASGAGTRSRSAPESTFRTSPTGSRAAKRSPNGRTRGQASAGFASRPICRLESERCCAATSRSFRT